MRKILDINYDGFRYKAYFDEEEVSAQRFRLYKIYWAMGKNGYTTERKMLLAKYSDLEYVFDHLRGNWIARRPSGGK